MGSVFTSLFGGGQSYDVPEYEPTNVPIAEATTEPEAKSVREESTRRIRRRLAGMNGTLLTRGLGANGNQNGLLGRSIEQ